MSQPAKKVPQKRIFVVASIILVVSIFVFGIVIAQKVVSDPTVVLLFPEQGADWIRYRKAIDLQAQKPQTLFSTFRTRFEVHEVPRKAILSFRAMKQASIVLDNQVLYKTGSHLNEWKKVYHIDLSSALTPGIHDLRIEVLNKNGHPAVLAYCKPLKIFTGEHWEGSIDSTTWLHALSVNETQPPLELSRKFQRADQAFFSKLHVFSLIFIMVFVCSLFLTEQNRPLWLTRVIPSVKGMRWVLMASWMLLSINNIRKIPLLHGMDIRGHMEYIRYVAENMSIPLATDGIEMFHPPLFYVLSAIVYKFFINFFSMEAVYRILRIVPLLCGAVQIELCYRALRYIYPKREDLQTLGIVVGSFLPMNIYISQVVGNEPIAGCLTGVVIVLAFRLFCSSSIGTTRDFILIGFFLGLGFLTKITAFLLVPPLLFFISYTTFINSHPTDKPIILIAQRVTIVLCVSLVISIWYYVRNWVELGHFLIVGWDPFRGFMWWQDPGYRTLQQFFTFGESLLYPIYSSVVGVWDSLYSTMWMDASLSGETSYDGRPPWNYPFLLSGACLSLLPSAAIFLGAIVSLRKPTWANQQSLLFSVSCIITYIFAILYMFLTLPVYSIAKATYMLGLTPCFAVLCAGGLDVLTRKPFLKATIYGIIACWAVGAFGSFFVFNYSPEEVYVKDKNYIGTILIERGELDEAIEHFLQALRIKPDYVDAHINLAVVLDKQGRTAEAIEHYLQALRIKPDYEKVHFNLALALDKQGRTAEAIEHYLQALRIKPDYVDAHNNLAVVFDRQGRTAEAIEHYLQALHIKPDYEKAHNNLAVVLFRKGNIEGAIAHFRKALRINPDYIHAKNNLKKVLMMQQQNK